MTNFDVMYASEANKTFKLSGKCQSYILSKLSSQILFSYSTFKNNKVLSKLKNRTKKNTREQKT